MNTKRRSSLSEVLQSRIKTPLIWGVLVITVGLTLLFYYSQNQRMVVYTRYVETLSDYKFLEMRLMRSMEQIRVRGTLDSTALVSQLMCLRETAISVAASGEEAISRGEWMPPADQFALFEREVLVWVSSVRRYLYLRTRWLTEARAFREELIPLYSGINRPVFDALDSAAAGFNVTQPGLSHLPPSLRDKALVLFADNADQASLWNRLDNDGALLRCEDLIQAFKMKNLDEMAAKFRAQQVFYLLSIVLLLFTLFFVFRSRK